ncbi:MAG: MaoC family dehydratase [Pseudomonadota bacterium]
MTRDELINSVGQTLGVSRWYELPQGRLNQFADVTEDWQFIHLDEARAQAETPFGGTVAHGFLTLSMLSAMSYDVMPDPEGATSGLNYGFDRLRFVAPVPAGARIRGHFALTAAENKGPDRLLLTVGVTVEIEGSETPAIVADWLNMFLF